MEDFSRQRGVLLVEENLADIRLTQDAFKELEVLHNLQVANDGMAALRHLSNAFPGLSGVEPNLILLDLNLPKLCGLLVLAAYRLNAYSYAQGPLEIEQFLSLIENIRRFWMETASLPDFPAGRTH